MNSKHPLWSVSLGCWILATLLFSPTIASAQANLRFKANTWSAPSSAQGYRSQLTLRYEVENSGNVNVGSFNITFYYNDSRTTSRATALRTVTIAKLDAGKSSGPQSTTVTLPGNVLFGTRYLIARIDPANAVPETNNSDNILYHIVTITGLPDLRVTFVGVAPSSQVPGGPMSLTYRFYNAGLSRASTVVYTRFYYSVNNSYESSDTYVGAQVTVYPNNSGLNAGAFFPASANGTTTFTLPSSATAGTRYILGYIDFNNRVRNESSENNNVYARQFSVVTQKPDLSMKVWTGPSSHAGYGTALKMTYNVQNTGTGNAGQFYVAFYYSTSTSTSNLTYLTRVLFSSLGAKSDTGNKTIDLTLPRDVTRGSRYIHYFIDYTSSVDEIREDNNRSSRRVVITGYPNLKTSYLLASPAQQVAGGQLSLRVQVYNDGVILAGASTMYCYYSSNNSIGSGDIRLSPDISVPQVQAKATHTQTAVVALPANVSPGAAYVVCRADANNRITETSNNDNDRAYKIEIIRAIADLEMATWSMPATSPGYNNQVKIDYTIRNRGNADATASTLTFYYTDTATFATSTALGTAAIKMLKAGETATGSLTVTLPGNVLNGKRFVHYFIDSANKVTESNETNNQGRKDLEITGQANLVASVLSFNPTSQVAGGQVAVTYQIKNIGLARAPQAHYARLYYSQDSTITTSDTFRTSVYTAALDAGASYPTNPGTTTVTVPASATTGTRYIGIIADYAEVVKESNEQDNTKSAALQVITSIADLSMDSWSLTPGTTAGAGDTITLKFKVKNGGQANAGASQVSFYYNDSTSTSNATLLGTANVGALTAGQTSNEVTLSVKLPNNVLEGTRYIHYYIDSANRVPESNESNNRGNKSITLNGKPNLIVSVLTVSPTSQIPGGYVTATYRITNNGKTRLPSYIYIGFYYSADGTITTGDTYLSRVYVSSLDAGSSFPTSGNGTVTLRIPTNAVKGSTGYIGAYADYQKRITESNDSDADNSKAAAVQIITSIADLSMSTWSINPTSVSGFNSTIDVSFRVRNSGSVAASNIKVSIYYGNTTSTTGLVEIGNLTIRRIDPNTTDSTQVLRGLKIPNIALNGSRYIHYYIDSDNQINEYNESNNRGYTGLTVNAVPNLQVSVLSVQPTSQGAGGSVTVTYRIYNSGLAAAENFKVGIYLSSDSTIDSKDTLLNTTTVPLLRAQAFLPGSSNGTATVTIPRTASPGSAYIGIFADYEEKVKELDEKDNTKATPFQVTAPKPDLAATSASVTPGTQKTGQSVTLTYNITNRGGADAGTSRMGIYFSTDPTIDANDTLIKNINLAGIKSGQSISQTEAVTLPATLPAGAGYIGFFVDNDAKIAESDENNNTASASLTVLTDKDQDGVYSDLDCNDNDKTIYPNAPELCDGKDNDCNKKIDDNPTCTCVTGTSRSCYTGASGCTQSGTSYNCTAPCQAGTQKCVNGQWEKTCNGEVVAQPETCNGKDDNCDGKVDENLSQKCYSGVAGTAGKGLCKEGVQTCTNGGWSQCVGEVTPKPESCDNQDNDCDGQVDNQTGSNKPLEQPCTSQCGNGVETCQNGQWANCTAPQTCEPGAEIPSEPTVDAGPADQPPSDQPADCYLAGCPTGQICQKGQCVPNPCDGVSCQADEFCRAGQCIKACDCTRCAANETCEDGQCVSDPCAGTNCPSGKVCDPNSGQCQDDPCQGISCGSGRICEAGTCVDDPCAHVQCPQGQNCRNGQCYGVACGDEEPGTSEGTTSDGGTTDGGDTDGGTTDAGGNESTTGETTTETGTQEGTTQDTTTQDTTAQDGTTQDGTAQDTTATTDKTTGGSEQGTTNDITPPGGGCGCHHEQTNPAPLLIFLFGLIALIGLRRRRPARV